VSAALDASAGIEAAQERGSIREMREADALYEAASERLERYIDRLQQRLRKKSIHRLYYNGNSWPTG
jgi:hypothetical protein